MFLVTVMKHPPEATSGRKGLFWLTVRGDSSPRGKSQQQDTGTLVLLTSYFCPALDPDPGDDPAHFQWAFPLYLTNPSQHTPKFLTCMIPDTV